MSSRVKYKFSNPNILNVLHSKLSVIIPRIKIY